MFDTVVSSDAFLVIIILVAFLAGIWQIVKISLKHSRQKSK